MTEQLIKNQSFKLKGRLYTLTVIQIMSNHISGLRHQLEEVHKQAPQMFTDTPVVLDCSLLEEDLHLADCIALLKVYGLIPIALQGSQPLLTSQAQACGLALMHSSSTQDKSLCTPFTETITPHLPEEGLSNRLIITPVRSGQQVVSKGGDLIVTASVSPGAELLADGNIHVYGTLRGRALAGISGDKSARIFCQALEAELIAIAGFYRLSDAITPQAGPCQIFLQGEHIIIESLC